MPKCANPECGNYFEARNRKGSPQVFCSKQCRVNIGISRRKKRRRENVPISLCVQCGGKFVYNVANKKTCSVSCREKRKKMVYKIWESKLNKSRWSYGQKEKRKREGMALMVLTSMGINIEDYMQ